MFGNGTRFVWHWSFAEEEEVGKGALVHAVDAGLIAMDEGELGTLCEGGVGSGHGLTGRLVRGPRGGGIIDELGFDGPAAALAPDGDGEFFDEGELDGVRGLEPFDEVVEMGLEALGGLEAEDGVLGQKAVTKGVGGGTRFAWGCNGSPGAGAIGAGCCDATKRRHSLNSPARC